MIRFLVALFLLVPTAAAQGFLDPGDYEALAPMLATGPGSGPIVVDTTAVTMTLSGGTIYEGALSPDGRAVFCFESIDLQGDPGQPGAVALDVGGLRPFALLSQTVFELAVPLRAGGADAVGAAGGIGGPGGGAGGDLGEPGTGFEGTKGLAGDAGGGGGGFSSGADGGGPNSGDGGLGSSSLLVTEDNLPIAGAGGGGSGLDSGGGGGGYVELGAACSLLLATATGDLSGGGFVDVSGGDGGPNGGGG
ncbi:MAG: hypothetical protein AAF368_05265, partial [Planctomycetota bacterium]